MICIDLDCTLIDSERSYKDEMSIAEGYGVSKKEYGTAVKKLYQRHGTAAYNFRLLYEILAETSRALLPWQMVTDLNALLNKNYFYPDSEEFLSSFEPRQLVIVTAGNPDFQWKKILAHNILRYANTVTITQNKAAAVAAELITAMRVGIKELTFVIDDAPREIEAVKKALPEVICIQIRQPASWETQRETVFYDVHFPAGLLPARDYIKTILVAST